MEKDNSGKKTDTTLNILNGTLIQIRENTDEYLYSYYGNTPKYRKRFNQWASSLLGSNGEGEHFSNLMDSYRSVAADKMLKDERLNDKSIYYYRGFISALNMLEQRIIAASGGVDNEPDEESEGDDVIINNKKQ
jgi:hypothetical protein